MMQGSDYQQPFMMGGGNAFNPMSNMTGMETQASTSNNQQTNSRTGTYQGQNNQFDMGGSSNQGGNSNQGKILATNLNCRFKRVSNDEPRQHDGEQQRELPRTRIPRPIVTELYGSVLPTGNGYVQNESIWIISRWNERDDSRTAREPKQSE
jgi:hypothetical protein